MEKLDLRKQYKSLYSPTAKKSEIIEVPPLQFAMIEGEIEPGAAPGTSPAFSEALGALYGISYTLKFMIKKQPGGIDYTVMGLEALWWVEGAEFDITQPSGWKWNAMILQPEFITPELFEAGREQLRKKRGTTSVDRLQLETFHEGLCVQMMHLGPYATEMQTIARMDAFMAENGYQARGKHHEIYLGDPLRSAPEKLKTILRHPVGKGGVLINHAQ